MDDDARAGLWWLVPVCLTVLVVLAAALLVPALRDPGVPDPRAADAPPAPAAPAAPPPNEAAPPLVVVPGRMLEPVAPPNVVLILLDDFSMDLVPTMRSMRRMAAAGASYPRSYVTDSLCCVSRASLLTGQYPHQTGVRTNSANLPNPDGPVGGWEAFRSYGNLERTVAVRLRDAGYHTGFVGKYLNEYEHTPATGMPPVPPGWDDLRVVFGNAYQGWDFTSTELVDGRLLLREHPAPPSWASAEEKDAAYAGTVIHEMTLDFLAENADRPYFLQVAPYAVHGRTGPGPYEDEPRFPAAHADRATAGNLGNCGPVRCGSLGVDDLPGWDDDRADNRPVADDGTELPGWNAGDGADRGRDVVQLRERARMAQSVDRLVGDVLDAVGDDTYVVLTSDNGLHLGQHDLPPGKGTAYRSDVQVPLYVVGPGIAPGPRPDVVSNVDLAPTLEALAGLSSPRYRAGESLLPSLRRERRERTRYAFHEHTWARTSSTDPDQVGSADRLDLIPSYLAVRGPEGLLVRQEAADAWGQPQHGWEYYPYDRVGWERANRFGDPGYGDEVAALRRRLEAFDDCRVHTGDEPVPASCRALRR